MRKGKRPRGICQVCKQNVALREDGSAWAHCRKGEKKYCEGVNSSYRFPVPIKGKDE